MFSGLGLVLSRSGPGLGDDRLDQGTDYLNQQLTANMVYPNEQKDRASGRDQSFRPRACKLLRRFHGR